MTQLVARNVELWAVIWSQRSRLQDYSERGVRYLETLQRLNASWIMMLRTRQANARLVHQVRTDWPISEGPIVRPLQTRLGHTAIHCWQYLQYSPLGMGTFPGDNPLVALMTLFSHAPTEDRNQLVQEAVVDTFAPLGLGSEAPARAGRSYAFGRQSPAPTLSTLSRTSVRAGRSCRRSSLAKGEEMPPRRRRCCCCRRCRHRRRSIATGLGESSIGICLSTQ